MKKLISIVLCMVLALGCLSVTAAAQEGAVYVVIGDSIAYGSGLYNAKDACYGRIIADTAGYDYVNHSKPGITSSGLKGYISSPTVSADLARADIVSLSIGGNDFLAGGFVRLIYKSIVNSDYSDFDAIAESYYENLSEIVGSITGANSDVVILLQTLYNPQKDYLRRVYQQGIDRLNDAMRRCADEYSENVVIVDVETALSDDMNNFASDSIHPSAKGNELIAETVFDSLVSLGLAQDGALVINEKGRDIHASAAMSMAVSMLGAFCYFLSAIKGILSPLNPAQAA